MSAAQPRASTATAHPVAERLDALMAVLLAYIKDVCHVDGEQSAEGRRERVLVFLTPLLWLPGSLHVDRTKELYRDLLSVFDKLILPTHASCHVQYALFYLCSFRLVSVARDACSPTL